MSDIVVIGGGFGGTWTAKALGARLLTRSNGFDINEIECWWPRLIKTAPPRVVINFASQSMVGQSWQNPTDWMQTNCVGQTKLLQALRGVRSLERYIHFTTPEVYGNTPTWVDENWNFRPSTPYAASRAAGDWMVKLWQEQYGFPAIFTRAANIYGEGQQLYRIIPKAILAKMEGQVVPLHGGGKSVRTFVHMDDVVSALRILIDHGIIGECYHISPWLRVSIKELVDQIGCMTMDAPDRPGKDEAYLLASDKLRKLGWGTAVSLSDGIDRVQLWFDANPNIWANMPREYEHRQ